MTTLTEKDIIKINQLYLDLARLQQERRAVKDCQLQFVRGASRQGTSGLEQHEFALGKEAATEFKDMLARDIRRQAAKIVESLHGYGCEAQLTEE